MTNIELINKFKGYADVADASYAMLHLVFENEEHKVYDKILGVDRWKYPDNITLGDKFEKDIEIVNKGGSIIEKKQGDNTAYARAIEARFIKNVILEKGTFKDKTINNDPKNVSASSQLSQRTINFVNRYRLLYHQADMDSGFSGTLFEDTQDSNQKIIVFRGTDISDFGDISADANLVFKEFPQKQYFDMIEFYRQCIIKECITESTPLVVVGHSLGGALAQLFALSIADSKNANNIKEVYTFNSPGAKGLQVKYNINPAPHFVIKFTKQELQKEEYINYKLNNALSDYYDIFKYEKQDDKKEMFDKELSWQLWRKTLALNNKTENVFYLGICFDPLNAMLPYVYDMDKLEGDRYCFAQKYYHCLYKNYMEQSNLIIHDNIYHIETSENSIYLTTAIDYQNNAIQDLWDDIDGIHYRININVCGLQSHYLEHTIKTLYLYSYLLSLDSNNTMLESKLKSSNNKERFKEYLHILNVFMEHIKTAMQILINEIDKENKEKYEKFRQETKWYKRTPSYDNIDYLALFISQINKLAFNIESIKEDKNLYFTSSIDTNDIIDILLKLQKYNYFIEIIDNDKLREMRNKCMVNNNANVTEKISLETCQPFRLVNNKNISYINENNFNQIFGYKGLGYIVFQEWDGEYINGRYKMMKGLYFGGNTQSSFSKYARGIELEIN